MTQNLCHRRWASQNCRIFIVFNSDHPLFREIFQTTWMEKQEIMMSTIFFAETRNNRDVLSSFETHSFTSCTVDSFQREWKKLRHTSPCAPPLWAVRSFSLSVLDHAVVSTFLHAIGRPPLFYLRGCPLAKRCTNKVVVGVGWGRSLER